MVWPTVMAALWEDRVVAGAILKTGEVVAPLTVPAPALGGLGDTGAFPMQTIPGEDL